MRHGALEPTSGRANSELSKFGGLGLNYTDNGDGRNISILKWHRME